MKIVSVSEMIQLEKNANNDGISYETMMRNAGEGIATWIFDQCNVTRGIAGLVGSGNNGGDTLIALSNLAAHNLRTFAFLVSQRPGDPLVTQYTQSGGTVIDISVGENLTVLETVLTGQPILLDGMLGTGFRLPLRGSLGLVMGKIKEIVNRRPPGLLIAVDCPSGLDCDTGEVSNETLSAEITLTMAAVKQGLLKYPAKQFTGEIRLIEIAIPVEESSLGVVLPEMLDSGLVNGGFPARPEDGHKGTFGTCLVIAGSKPYTGAAYLAGKAAYRSGCGLVNVATVDAVRDALAGELIEAVWTILPESEGAYDPAGIELLEPALQKTNSLVVGPGWGLLQPNTQFLDDLLKVIPNETPTIFDADGLKLLTQIKDWWNQIPENTVLTPHPGEMSILSGLSIGEIEANRWTIAREYAQKWGVTLVLKGALTVIGTPDGHLFINPIGDSALACAGSGDVLSGVVGGFMAQGVAAHKAAVLGVWVHSKAGLSARQTVGSAAGVTALDILNCVGENIS